MSNTSMSKILQTPNGEEPAMFLQRPSSGSSQDVRHILARCFRDLYMREAVRQETVENLRTSKGGDDPYHERYVERLQGVYTEWQTRMETVAMLERHIMQAQARAMSADERDIYQANKKCGHYSDLGLPPQRAHFKSCIDNHLLREHHLLTPEDYATEEPVHVPLPSGPPIPSYARETLSSHQHSQQDETESQPFESPGSKESLEYSISVSEDSREKEFEVDKPVPMEDKFPEKSAWKTHMRTEEREAERQSLENLQAKANFLRNAHYIPPLASGNKSLIKLPKRQPKEINIQRKPEKQEEEEAPVFIASPKVVVFNDYKVGHVYETTLELKNVSTVMRSCRVLPPTTSFFSVGLGQFPGNDGLVAPGMSCLYPVRFAPDSLKDYDDKIIIQTQASQSLVIHLQGRREPPVLTLPSNLDVGYCLVAGFQVTQFALCNKGGPGRFCIMPRTSWPATNFKSVMVNGSVILTPFEIRPSTIELASGQTTVIEIMFRPTAVRIYTQEFTILCDNCHAKHFTLKGEGQIVKVTLTQHNISSKFDDLNPFTYTERAISVKNCTDVELPFQWMVYKPQMPRGLPENAAAPDGLIISEQEEDRVPELNSVFSVHPSRGFLMPADTMEFFITFAPPVVSEFHSVVHLLLQQMPATSQGVRIAISEDEHSSPDENDEFYAELNPSDPQDLKFCDLTGLEIELKGRSVPLNVVLHPYALYLSGSHLFGTTVKKLFTMANHSFSTINFQWEAVHDSQIILEVEPPYGELDPGMAMDLEVSITGCAPGHISQTLYCSVLNLDEPLHLHIEADIKGPEVTIDEPHLNFGLVRLGDTVAKELTLTNMVQLTTKWTLKDMPHLQSESMIEASKASEFTFIPNSGELRPLEETKVTVVYKPTDTKTVQNTFLLEVENGGTVALGVCAEVQKPVVCLLACNILLPEVYVGVPAEFTAVIHNQTLLPSKFAWDAPEGSHASDCIINIREPRGLLTEREQRVLSFSFCAQREGDFSEVRIPCFIEGQEEPLFLNISCTVLGLSVRYRTCTDGLLIRDDCFLNIEDMTLGQSKTFYLHICNQTAITADFSLVMEKFPAVVPSPPQFNHPGHSDSKGRPSLIRTPNLADPLSKMPVKSMADMKRTVLGLKRGLAFLLQPSSGTLTPFSEQIIAVTAFSNMWGHYCDNIICKVGELDPTYIPVNINITGCPLNFQMTAANPDQKTTLRYGTLVAGVAPVTRFMQINNISPYDVRLDWKVFNCFSNDEKLLDLVVCYGRAFPQRDAYGNEVVPSVTDAGPAIPTREPSDYAPGSAETKSQEFSYDATVSADSQDSVRSNGNTEQSFRDRPKLISLFLRPHDGVEGLKPFTISPSQLVIPAYNHKGVHMIFTPPPVEEVTEPTDCISYAMGFMSLDSMNANIPGTVERSEGYLAATLRVDFTAHVKPALLTVEEADEDGMYYCAAMSDILDGEKVMSEFLHTCSVKLSNTTQTPLTFCLKVNPPFVMVNLNPASNTANATRSHETGFHTLKPSHHIMVKVALRITPTLLSEYQMTCTENEGKQLSTEKSLEINDDLIIEFNNSAQQKVTLRAKVAVPNMVLSCSELDFGICLVGQRRELQIFISNTTASHCKWSASFESKSDTCTQDTFQISPTHGQLDAYITHISNSKTLLSVYFTAKHAETYEAVILFGGVLGESAQRLHLRGQGSYDGKHEAILNV
ncbi:hypothetical protein C0Q70_10369 [Pomacea canaliculata]|uniref:Deleted in lung and esophageal cancer protein 1 n=1 Tax=Pomacea canaliculata TaxID=400727 RepID=A0A2T7PCF6_POMCA|nr:hypothetical protein C0Q70_10369 [Pomacea canaliculata]